MLQVQGRERFMMVVEDSDEDFEALNRVISQINPGPLQIQRCIDGDDALDFLQRKGPYNALQETPFPDLIVLDLNLPGTDGREVLSVIKHSETLQMIPVVILSTSSNPRDIQACYRGGSNSYILKPLSLQELKVSVQIMLDYWLKAVVLPVTANDAST